MINEISYASKSLSYIGIDNIVAQSGTVTVNLDKSVTLGSNSLVSYDYTYNYTNNRMMAQFIKVGYAVDTGATLFSRYRDDVTIDILVEYFKESISEEGVSLGYIDGPKQFSRIMPYYKHEEIGAIAFVEIPLEDLLIKKITLTLRYTGVDVPTVTFDYVSIYNSRTTTEVVTDTYGMSISLSGIVGYINGCHIFYDNEPDPTVLLYKEDLDGNFSGIKINPGTSGERFITFARVNEIILD